MSAPIWLDDLNGPALLPPHGVEANFTTASHARNWYYVCAVLCTTLPGFLVFLRLYTKIFILRKVDKTDYIAVAAFLMFMPMVAIGRVLLSTGAGAHQWNIRYKDFFDMLYWLNVDETIYGPVILLIKVAILLQYLALLAPCCTVNAFLFYGAWGVIVTNTLFYVATTLLSIFRCSPREAIWNHFVKDAKCINVGAAFIVTTVFNITSDLVILLLPIRSVWALRIPTRRNISISMLFATGSLACVANIGVILFLLRMGEANADVSYNAAWMGLCIFAEVSLGISVSCMLSLPKLIESKADVLLNTLSRCLDRFKFLRSGSRSHNPKLSQQRDGGSSFLPAEAHLPQFHSPDIPQFPPIADPLWSDMIFESGDHLLNTN